MFIQQQLFRVISVLKKKGLLITSKIIYLLFFTHMHCFREGFPPCWIFQKHHFNNIKNDSDHIIVKYSLYSHTMGDRCYTII